MSTKTHSSERTTDHETIRRWVEERGGKPATVRSTERHGDAGILRIEFPSSSAADDAALDPITWEEFFGKFDCTTWQWCTRKRRAITKRATSASSSIAIARKSSRATAGPTGQSIGPAWDSRDSMSTPRTPSIVAQK